MEENKFLIVGTVEGNRLVLKSWHNLNYVAESEVYLQEDEQSFIVDAFDNYPPNADLSKYFYTPYYNLLTSKIEYDETPIPPPEPTEEQKKIASLETQLTDTQLALCEIFESIGG